MPTKCLASHPFAPQALCTRPLGHPGDHAGVVEWTQFPGHADETPTAKLPPIRETTRRRPPPPRVQELTDRVELVEALARELSRELAELGDVDEDLADDDREALRARAAEFDRQAIEAMQRRRDS